MVPKGMPSALPAGRMLGLALVVLLLLAAPGPRDLPPSVGPGSGRLFAATGTEGLPLVARTVVPAGPGPAEGPAPPLPTPPDDNLFPEVPAPLPAGPTAERRKTVYLTFDDGPSHNTLAILDILRQYGVPATFFVCGNIHEFGRNAYRRIVAEGHALGNHSFSHNLERIYASAEAFWEDFHRLQELLDGATGQRPRLVRFPGGSNNGYAGRALMAELIAGLGEEGYRHFDWNVCSGDATIPPQDAGVIVQRVLDGVRAKDRAVVLFHDSSSRTTTVEALPAILDALIAAGFEFRALSADSPAVQFPR